MKAGKLRERISIQRRAESQNEFGESRGIWRDLFVTWGSVEPLAGREFFSALQVQSDISIRVTCRYAAVLADVSAKDRIKHGATVYDIRSVINVESRNRELQFMCTEHSDD